MNAEEYRLLQYNAFHGHGGTTELEVVAAVSWMLFGMFFYGRVVEPRRKSVLLQFAVLIVPQILLFLSPHLWMVVYPLTVATIVLFGRPHPPRVEKKLVPFITAARAAIMVMCTLGILAVDFLPFPRRFAKTETFGVSLMDVGVGCVVVSMGLTTANRWGEGSVFRAMRSTLPLLILGLIRVLMVKSLDYHVHSKK
jgi:hypothetical protein